MEQKIIDASILQEVMDGNIAVFEQIDGCTAETMRMCKTIIESQQTVDAVQVVRCGECRLWNRAISDTIGGHPCERFSTSDTSIKGMTRESDFCSYGKIL